MKKVLAFLIALSMLCMLCACAKADKPAEETQTPDAVEPAPDETTPDAPVEEEPAPEEAPEVNDSADTIGTKLLADFKAKAAEGLSAEELANAMLESSVIEFAGATMPVEPGFLNGFAEEINGFAEGAMFAPMIGSIPFVGYIFQLEDGADTTAFMEQLKGAADMRWNICTEADELVCDAAGQTVFFVMCPNNFEE